MLVDGKLNVPGAPEDSQTVPAKFSERNDRIDKLPIMAMPLGLSDAQRRAILDSVKQADQPVQTTSAKPAEELPADIVVHDLGVSANIPEVARLKICADAAGRSAGRAVEPRSSSARSQNSRRGSRLTRMRLPPLRWPLEIAGP